MKKLILSSLMALALVPVAGVQADLLINGDFSSGSDRPDPEPPGNGQLADGWTQWSGGGWNNREINANGIAPDDFHLALGNGAASDNGAYQNVPATEGLIYEFSVDSGSPDAWWHPAGAAAMEFWDAGGTVLDTATVSWVMPGFDVPMPFENYSVSAVAPVGTTEIRAVLMNQGPDGGTMRFDNAVLAVIPEPTSLALMALGALLVRSFRRK